jgi:chemotaxis protein methyltransferase CheR
LSVTESVTDQQLEQIGKIMRDKLGKDLKQFKKPFLNRRISARMRSVGATNGSEYAQILASNENEPTFLFKSFSINVTEFYRDLFVWQCLSSKIIPEIAKNRTSLNVWSAGCASGEEPYSLAILLSEALGSRTKFSVIATDISAEAIVRAKKGQYTNQNIKNLTPALVSKYLSNSGKDTYTVNDSIKQLVTFEQADIISCQVDKLDLITCRNVLIYYDKPAQELIFKKFHKSLVSDGQLVIGQDETMMGVEAAKLFSCKLARERIYSKAMVQ